MGDNFGYNLRDNLRDIIGDNFRGNFGNNFGDNLVDGENKEEESKELLENKGGENSGTISGGNGKLWFPLTNGLKCSSLSFVHKSEV